MENTVGEKPDTQSSGAEWTHGENLTKPTDCGKFCDHPPNPKDQEINKKCTRKEKGNHHPNDNRVPLQTDILH